LRYILFFVELINPLKLYTFDTETNAVLQLVVLTTTNKTWRLWKQLSKF